MPMKPVGGRHIVSKCSKDRIALFVPSCKPGSFSDFERKEKVRKGKQLASFHWSSTKDCFVLMF